MLIIGCNILDLIAVDTAGSVDLVNCDLTCIGNVLSVNGNGAGDRSDFSDDPLEFAIIASYSGVLIITP